MGQDYSQLVSVFKNLLNNQFAPKPRYTRALMGDGQGNVLVPGKGKEDKVLVRFNRSSTETSEVFNKEVNPVDGWPVLIGEFPWQPGLTQVICTDWSAYEQVGWGESVGGLDPHHLTHEWPEGKPGSDPLNTYIRSIAPLKTYSPGSGSTQIFVSKFQYEYFCTGSLWPGVPGIELSGAIPVTGSQRYMGVYHNPITNTIHTISGTTTVFTETIEPDRPAFPCGMNPSAWVRLYGGQVTIKERDIKDARRLFGNTPPTGPAGGDLTGSYPNPLVYGIVGYPIVDPPPPSDNDILVFSGSGWHFSPTATGTSSSGWPFENIVSVSTTDPDADYSSISSALVGSPTVILLDAETFTTSTLTLTTAVSIVGIDPINTIITCSSGHTIHVNVDDVVIKNLTVENTSGGSVAGCIVGDDNNLVVENVTVNKVSGAATNGYGLWNFGGANWRLQDVKASVSGSTSAYGYRADTAASSANIIDGQFWGDTDDISLNHASAEATLRNTTLVSGDANLSNGEFKGSSYDSGYSRLMQYNPRYSIIETLPGLVGHWMFTTRTSGGGIYNVASSVLTLTRQGNPDVNLLNNKIAYAHLDGTDDYFTRADEAVLDIDGTEADIDPNIQGLTLFGWVSPDAASTSEGIFTKWGSSTNRAYGLHLDGSGDFRFAVSGNGSTLIGVEATSTTVTGGVWYFIAGVYVPSTSIDIYIKTTEIDENQQNTTSIPASLFNSSQGFEIGRFGANDSLCFDGRVASCTLVAAALPAEMLDAIFRVTRDLFEV